MLEEKQTNMNLSSRLAEALRIFRYMIGPVFCSTLGLFTSHHMNFFGVDDLGKNYTNAYIHIHRKRSRKTTDNEYRQTYLALVRREVV